MILQPTLRLQAQRWVSEGVLLMRRICIAFAVTTLVLCCEAAFAQDQRQAPPPSSDLERANMALVAASAAEIKTVLVKDTGLMVELKRWVAKDATDHGQIIDESDLTEDAIFNRLELDVRFRSVATQLLQRYGYLIPKLNPDSPNGKEQDLLIAERVKWIAQQEEEARGQERAKADQALQQARACSQAQTQMVTDCSGQQPGLGTTGQGRPTGQGNQQNTPTGPPGASPSQTNPFQQLQPNQQNLPTGNANLLEAAQLMQSGADSTGLFPGQANGSPNLALALSNEGSTNGTNLAPNPYSQQSGNLGLLNMTGAAGLLGMGDQTDLGFSDTVPQGGLQGVSPAYPLGTPVVPMQS